MIRIGEQTEVQAHRHPVYRDLGSRAGTVDGWGGGLFSREIRLKRRSVQSHVEISLFSLDESGSPSP
jgi:hypothetical protein